MTTESDFLGKKLLVVTAHPDDESFVAAGSIYKNIQLGGSTHVLCATHGGNGRAYLETPHTEAELKERRRSELVAVARVLQISEYRVLDYPDGRCEQFKDALAGDIRAVIELWKPDALLTFGVDGFTGHSDHIAVHYAATAVASSLGVPVFYASVPPDPHYAGFVAALQGKRKCNTYSEASSVARDSFRIVIDGQKKLEALRCYASQWLGLDPYRVFSPELAEHFLAYEYVTRG